MTEVEQFVATVFGPHVDTRQVQAALESLRTTCGSEVYIRTVELLVAVTAAVMALDAAVDPIQAAHVRFLLTVAINKTTVVPS